MAVDRKIIKVFLGSPGDLVEERAAARQVVENLNQLWADFLGIHVELIGWEQIASRSGRPQDTINRLALDQCDIFIGMLWKHWGTPPDINGPYSSGFEEEFERSFESFKTTKKPEMSLLFKDVEDAQVKDAGPELTKVLEFKERLITDKIALFMTFRDVRDFEGKLERCLISHVQTIASGENTIGAQQQSDPSSSPVAVPAQVPAVVSETPLSAEGTQFVREFLDKSERNLTTHPFMSDEIARFRLISGLVKSTGNDERTLGVHDANILFSKRNEISFGERELDGLVDAGLERYASQVVPLWYWYTAGRVSERGSLMLSTFIGTSRQRIGALQVLTFLQEPIVPPIWFAPEYPARGRGIFVQTWFSEAAENDLRIAALDYLASCGIADDIPLVQAEVDRKNYQTVAPATHALLRLLFKQGRDVALSKLLELQTDSVDDTLVRDIFKNPAGIETSLLLSAAIHQSAAVRRAVVTTLVARRALTDDIAGKLLTDADPQIRYQALSVLVRAGKTYSDEQAKAILVKPTTKGFASIFGTAVPDKEGEAVYERFRSDRLKKMELGALGKRVAASNVTSQVARFALDRRSFSKRATALRADVDDKFKSRFDADMRNLPVKIGASEKLVQDLIGLETTIRKGATRAALDVLSEKGDPVDLERIRKALAENFVEDGEHDIEYLAKHGEWQDIELLIDLNGRPNRETTGGLLGMVSGNKSEVVGEAISQIGKGRLADLLTIDLPPRLRVEVVKRMQESEVAGLNDDELIKLFMSEDDRIRKWAVIKSIRVLSKRRLRALLDRYMNPANARFYNVIHWLDCGLCLPKSVVSRGTAQILSRE
jgi:hypothetical protein